MPESAPLDRHLQKLIDRSFTAADFAHLEALTLADDRSPAFGITAANVGETVQRRSRLLRNLYPAFREFCQGWRRVPLEWLWVLWIPLALQLIEQHKARKFPLVQGILGGQGTGKTTLTAVLTLILRHLGYGVARLSLDDLYKTYADRLLLTDARLRWRGPPGTHDIDLGIATLQQIRRGETTPLPRFDKSAHNGLGDRTQPEWVTDVQIVLFEGWFVGLRPIDPQAFDTAPAPIVTAADRAFARDCNVRLGDYLPLWQHDRLIVLLPVDYRLSQQWRRQAEQQMKAAGQSGMTDRAIDEFVVYFWQALHPSLFLPPLLHDPTAVNLVVEINPDHTPGRIYCPGKAMS